jgi:hypothetical protein
MGANDIAADAVSGPRREGALRDDQRPEGAPRGTNHRSSPTDLCHEGAPRGTTFGTATPLSADWAAGGGRPVVADAATTRLMSGTDHPVLSGTDRPAPSGTGHPILPGTDHPAPSGTDHPVLPGTDHPTPSGTGHPILPGTDHPAPSGTGHPVLPGTGHPGRSVSGTGHSRHRRRPGDRRWLEDGRPGGVRRGVAP